MKLIRINCAKQCCKRAPFMCNGNGSSSVIKLLMLWVKRWTNVRGKDLDDIQKNSTETQMEVFFFQLINRNKQKHTEISNDMTSFVGIHIKNHDIFVHSHRSHKNKIILALLHFQFSNLDSSNKNNRKKSTRHIGCMIRSRQRSIVMRFLCNILLISLFNKQHE